MQLQERVLSYMENQVSRPVNKDDIASGLKLKDEELAQFFSILNELEKKGVIVCNRYGLYGLPNQMNLVVGSLAMNSKGFGFVIADSAEELAKGDVFIPPTLLNSAMNKDKVIARLNTENLSGRSREGEIVRILEHANKEIVGTFTKNASFGFVTPDDKKLMQDVFIHKRNFNGASTDTKVVVSITKWPKKRQNPEGKIIKVLGNINDPGVDILSVINQYELPLDFPDEVKNAAKKIPLQVDAKEYKNRVDRRALQIVTVDGEDAKDLDDGVYAKKLDNGNFFLGVYIADVGHYVRENSPLDLEARKRGTSVYLVDRVIPMLPTRLSNGICSLNAGEDRLSMGAEMQINENGEIISYKLVHAVIHVYRRLTYTLVNKILVDKDAETVKENADLLNLLHTLHDLRDVLKKHRNLRGSIDFNIPEVKVQLDNRGKPTALLKRVGSLGESIIEECMLAANETVAQHMFMKKTPFIYRIHEQPDKEKIDSLNELLAAFHLHISKDSDTGEIEPKSIQQVLAKIVGQPEERIISSVALRTMQQARYSEENKGHFGLAAKYYTHFTSPIRRYPDLIVHRLLTEFLPTESLTDERVEKLNKLLPEIAQSSSARERVATDAERDTVDMKEIEYMTAFIGNEFKAVISGVTAFGIFVELDNGVEGLIHVSSMANDYYEYVEKQYALVGRRTGTVYKIGDVVDVVLMRADVKERIIDFILKGNGVYTQIKTHSNKAKNDHKKTVKKKKSPVKHTDKFTHGDKHKGKAKHTDTAHKKADKRRSNNRNRRRRKKRPAHK